MENRSSQLANKWTVLMQQVNAARLSSSESITMATESGGVHRHPSRSVSSQYSEPPLGSSLSLSGRPVGVVTVPDTGSPLVSRKEHRASHPGDALGDFLSDSSLDVDDYTETILQMSDGAPDAIVTETPRDKMEAPTLTNTACIRRISALEVPKEKQRPWLPHGLKQACCVPFAKVKRGTGCVPFFRGSNSGQAKKTNKKTDKKLKSTNHDKRNAPEKDDETSGSFNPGQSVRKSVRIHVHSRRAGRVDVSVHDDYVPRQASNVTGAARASQKPDPRTQLQQEIHNLQNQYRELEHQTRSVDVKKVERKTWSTNEDRLYESSHAYFKQGNGESPRQNKLSNTGGRSERKNKRSNKVVVKKGKEIKVSRWKTQSMKRSLTDKSVAQQNKGERLQVQAVIENTNQDYYAPRETIGLNHDYEEIDVRKKIPTPRTDVTPKPDVTSSRHVNDAVAFTLERYLSDNADCLQSLPTGGAHGRDAVIPSLSGTYTVHRRTSQSDRVESVNAHVEAGHWSGFRDTSQTRAFTYTKYCYPPIKIKIPQTPCRQESASAFEALDAKVCGMYKEFEQRYWESKRQMHNQQKFANDKIMKEFFRQKLDTLDRELASLHVNIECHVTYYESQTLGGQRRLSRYQKRKIFGVEASMERFEKLIDPLNDEARDTDAHIKKLIEKRRQILSEILIPRLPRDSPGNDLAFLIPILEGDDIPYAHKVFLQKKVNALRQLELHQVIEQTKQGQQERTGLQSLQRNISGNLPASCRYPSPKLHHSNHGARPKKDKKWRSSAKTLQSQLAEQIETSLLEAFDDVSVQNAVMSRDV